MAWGLCPKPCVSYLRIDDNRSRHPAPCRMAVLSLDRIVILTSVVLALVLLTKLPAVQSPANLLIATNSEAAYDCGHEQRAGWCTPYIGHFRNPHPPYLKPMTVPTEQTDLCLQRTFQPALTCANATRRSSRTCPARSGTTRPTSHRGARNLATPDASPRRLSSGFPPRFTVRSTIRSRS